MPPKTEQQKQLDELRRQEQGEASGNAGPPVEQFGKIAPDIIKANKLKQAEDAMDTNERKQYMRVRTAKYGYPPVK